jgi:hypothetical protein
VTEPNNTPIDDPWLDELNRLLAATPDLGPAQWVARGEGLLRLITPRPHGQVMCATLNRNEKVLEHLASWRDTPELRVLVAQTDFDSEGSPAIIVRDGRLCIFCGDDPEAAVPVTFDGWFKSLLGRPFPLSGWGNKLRAIGQHQWVTPGVAERDIQGFPHPLSVAGRTTYRLAAFGGHGMNSYAIYLTDVRPGLSLRLRLSFGGVYGDAERDSAAVLTTVQRLYTLVDAVGARLAHFELESDMGRHRARLRGTAGEWEGWVDDLEDLESVAREVAEGGMPALRNRGRRPH